VRISNMVDVTAAILGSVFGGLFLLTFIWAISIQMKYNEVVPAEPNAFFIFLKTWFGLTPYVFFLAGFVIDAVNASFMYSKASVVGALSVLITAVFGSDKFANLATSFSIPSIYTSSADPLVPGGFNWWAILLWLIIGLTIFLPMIFGAIVSGGGTTSWGWGSTAALGSLAVVTALAANNFLGSPTSEPFPPRRPDSGWFLNLGRTDVCTTPGLNFLQTRIAPAGILLSTSILTSHMFESLDTGNTKNAIASGGIALLSFAVELAIFMASGCSTDYRYGKAAPFISLALGTGAGATAYYTMKRVGQESFTSSSSEGGVFHPPAPPETVSKKSTDTKITVGPKQETSAPVDDQDAFVCEAYKDGELITSTIVD
jgi:hypothetical protein